MYTNDEYEASAATAGLNGVGSAPEDTDYDAAAPVGRDTIDMESGGTVSPSSSKYVEEDDVLDSIAEGYF